MRTESLVCGIFSIPLAVAGRIGACICGRRLFLVVVEAERGIQGRSYLEGWRRGVERVNRVFGLG